MLSSMSQFDCSWYLDFDILSWAKVTEKKFWGLIIGLLWLPEGIFTLFSGIKLVTWNIDDWGCRIGCHDIWCSNVYAVDIVTGHEGFMVKLTNSAIQAPSYQRKLVDNSVGLLFPSKFRPFFTGQGKIWSHFSGITQESHCRRFSMFCFSRGRNFNISFLRICIWEFEKCKLYGAIRGL